MIEIITGFDIFAKIPADSRTVVADETARLALTWLYTGLIVYQTDNGNIYKYKGDTTTNTVDDWEIKRTFFITEAIPTEALGVINDIAVNKVSKIFYEKTAVDTWTELFNFSGAQIYTVTGAPDDGDGANGDVTIRDNGGVYRKEGGTWILQFNIAGEDGEDGDLYSTTSATSIDLDSVAFPVTFTVETGLSYSPGQEVVIASQADPLVDYIIAKVKSYNGGTGDLIVDDDGSASINGTAAHVDWSVSLNGAVGQQGVAFVHTEADINLTQAKIDLVEGGTWTPVAPWSASILNDTRVSGELTATPGIEGSMAGKSIYYNGTAWINNGTWRGPKGDKGDIGDEGEPGIKGDKGDSGGVDLIELTLTTPIKDLTKAYYSLELTDTESVVIEGGNQVGTILVLSRNKVTSPAIDGNIPLDAGFSGTIQTVNTNNKISHKGRLVTSIPKSIRSITLLCTDLTANNNTWIVIGEVSYKENEDILNDKPAIPAYVNTSLQTTSETTVVINAPNFYGRDYNALTFQRKRGWRPLILATILAQSNSNQNVGITLKVERSLDAGATWVTIRAIGTEVAETDYPSTISIHVLDNSLDTTIGTGNINYRLRLTCNTGGQRVFASNNADIVIIPIIQ